MSGRGGRGRGDGVNYIDGRGSGGRGRGGNRGGATSNDRGGGRSSNASDKSSVKVKDHQWKALATEIIDILDAEGYTFDPRAGPLLRRFFSSAAAGHSQHRLTLDEQILFESILLLTGDVHEVQDYVNDRDLIDR